MFHCLFFVVVVVFVFVCFCFVFLFFFLGRGVGGAFFLNFYQRKYYFSLVGFDYCCFMTIL